VQHSDLFDLAAVKKRFFGPGPAATSEKLSRRIGLGRYDQSSGGLGKTAAAFSSSIAQQNQHRQRTSSPPLNEALAILHNEALAILH
jgi:hypothetical protein